MYFEIINEIEEIETIAVGGKFATSCGFVSSTELVDGANSKEKQKFVSITEEYERPKYTGTKPMGSVERK